VDPLADSRAGPNAGARQLLVAESAAGRIVGYIGLQPTSRLASTAHVRQVNGLAVAPDARRSGIARALLEAAIEHARARGVRRLTLRVLAPNAPARALYASFGFVEEGVLRGEFLIGGREVDDVLMARSL
jgi:ribosomal protein S18 acetylase RimI-like enzyme